MDAPVFRTDKPFRLRAEKRVLHFRRPARTSRGALTERVVYYLTAETDEGTAIGECCTMPGLSPEEGENYEALLHRACREAERQRCLMPGDWQHCPSLLFGLESLFWGLQSPGAPLWDTAFARGEAGIPMHHLIWMDTARGMLEQMEEGVRRGFTCLKLKVGALPFEEECELLQEIRQRCPQTELRVDANGAFRTQDEALRKMQRLYDCGVAWLEQPLPRGHLQETAFLAEHSPLPLALDEELIAAVSHDLRARLLDAVMPQGIVIKPSLHGGWSGTHDWVALAEERGIRTWLNSALESHVGLSVLAQWCGRFAPDTLHGLGTGCLYRDDSSPLRPERGRLWCPQTQSPINVS